MSPYFWPTIIVMTMVAIAFLARPLVAKNRRIIVVALVLAVPTFAMSFYLVFGSPEIESGRSAQSAMNAAGPSVGKQQAGNEKVASVTDMLDGLSQRLTENPDDGKGWLLLARSYKHVNRSDEAIEAYSRAAALGEYDGELSAMLESAARKPSNLPAAQIFGNLSLSERAAEIVLPTDTVFIFARPAGGSGVPAAVFQRPASELPIDFLLNDSQSMVDGIRLSDFDEVVVTARISRSGDATEALQGLEARTNSITVSGGEHHSLIIE